jgi:hypothetical protein
MAGRQRGQRAEQVQPVGVGQHKVEQDEVEGARAKLRKAGRAGLGEGDLELARAQIVRDHGGKAGVVVDEEDAGHGGGHDIQPFSALPSLPAT